MDAAAAGMSVHVQSELVGELYIDVATGGLERAGSFGLFVELGGNISPGSMGVDGAVGFLDAHIAAAGADFGGAFDFVEGDVAARSFRDQVAFDIAQAQVAAGGMDGCVALSSGK